MTDHTGTNANTKPLTLVLGGTGKTGRRVARQLKERGVPTRIGSRTANPAFDWDSPEGWPAVLAGVSSVYISFSPDLAVPGAKATIQRFVDLAVASGVKRLVLLSGRGEEEAQACEKIVQASDTQWTVVRASWFMQNFSEGEFLEMVQSGAITLPAGDIEEPFVDINDIADVAVAALTEEGHAYETYEVTGPRLMTFTQAAEAISAVTSHDVQFIPIPLADFNQAIESSGAPAELVWLLNYLFETILDGRNAYLGDGVQRALGREPADFNDFARRVSSRTHWRRSHQDESAA